MSNKQNITILGSTGSIGVNTLNVIADHQDQYNVFALTACQNIELLFQQCCQFKPAYAVIVDTTQAKQLEQQLKFAQLATKLLVGTDALNEVVTSSSVDVVMAAIVGAAGLVPTLKAVQSGKRVLLANKEPLVMAGSLFVDAVKKNNALLLPVDSEHNAIFQCLPDNFRCGIDKAPVEKILLTASGGPFRNTPINELEQVTPEQAIKHPNWNMGKKISIDSATMMNKGLEVIEAYWLFGVDIDDIDVIIHPQSTIHSMIAYNDGSIIAQLGNPDMRTPIAHALSWPKRIKTTVNLLDFVALKRLEFQALDMTRYPCLKLAYAAIKQGGSAQVALNAANEVAVALFLGNRIKFTQIAQLIAEVLERHKTVKLNGLDDIIHADKIARQLADDLCSQMIM